MLNFRLWFKCRNALLLFIRCQGLYAVREIGTTGMFSNRTVCEIGTTGIPTKFQTSERLFRH